MTREEWKDVIGKAILNVHNFTNNACLEKEIKCLLKSLYDAL